MNKVAFYAPEDDDGDVAYTTIVDALEGDEERQQLMEAIAAPLVKTILDCRLESELEDEEFFIAVAYVIADAVGIVTEVAVSDGKQEFVRGTLRTIGAVLAHKIGIDAVPEREECLDVIRRLYH